MKLTQKIKAQFAFTIIELLVVIGIIALLSGIVVWGVTRAASARKLNRVRVELHQLETAIDAYHERLGFYPPDNTNDCRKPPLFYELTGTTNITEGPRAGTHSTITGEFIPQTRISEFFYIDGFVNSNPETVRNFFPEMKGYQHRTIQKFPGTPIINIQLLTVPIGGLNDFSTLDDNPQPLNTWRYVSTHATNNPTTYDLWAEVVLGSKTHIIGNWKE